MILFELLIYAITINQMNYVYIPKNVLKALCTVSKRWEKQKDTVDIPSDDDILKRFQSVVKTISGTFL